MQKSNKQKFRSKSYRHFKRKIIFSQELKKSFFNAFCEAKNKQTYVTSIVLLYGLLSQQNSLCYRLFLKSILLSKGNNQLTYEQITQQIKTYISQNKLNNLDTLNQIKISSLTEKEKTPPLTPEVKEILKSGIRSALISNKKISVVTTKDIFFELINRESIRDLLSQLVI